MLGKGALPGRLALVILAAMVGLVLPYPIPGASSAPLGSPDRGHVIYHQHCLSCHGLTGNGDGAEATHLSPRPASLISAGTSAKSDKELLQIIDQGKPHTAMRSWNGLLTDEEQRDVLAYIRSLIQFRPSLDAPPPPSQSGH